jgi:trans-2,3-dihydro-3-hydroxyanthranilate isomerase
MAPDPKVETTELDYFVVDAFTDTALTGNPLAVVIDTVGLPGERMLAIAREFNLSETTFVQRRPAPIEKTEGVRVRIFTTQEELPFAGHPTLGTASILYRTAPEIVADSTITLALNIGPVPVRLIDSQDNSTAVFGEMTQRDPQFGEELDPSTVAHLTGLSSEDLDPSAPPQVVSTGTAFAIVPLRSADALARLNVNQHDAGDYLRKHGARWFYVLGPTGSSDPDFRARMQFNGGEDPATGSAAGCAISYLVACKAALSGRRIHLRQGVEIGRASDLFLSAKMDSAKITDVRVGGSTVLVAKGRIFLP